MTLVKLCGINSGLVFDAAVEAEADYLGLQFFPPSPRYVTPGRAAGLSARHTGGPKRVGLFVAPSDDEVRTALAAVRLDVLQVYADAARCRALRGAFGVRVWRAVGVAAAADLPTEDEGLDGFVIEPKPPAGASRPGGNAVAMDWSMLTGWRAPGFWLLAGGLNAGNVQEAIRVSGAPGVDVSSGVETAPGVKSVELISEFVLIARGGG